MVNESRNVFLARFVYEVDKYLFDGFRGFEGYFDVVCQKGPLQLIENTLNIILWENNIPSCTAFVFS